MTNVQQAIPNVVLDLRYATTNNFTHRVVYPPERAVCLLQPQTAVKLGAAAAELASEGLAFKLFDCYRPLAVQRIFWAIVPDERYVADPKKGSRHNRGAAVDLTLTTVATGKELPMGTDFDNFTEKAHRDFNGLTSEEAANRAKLESVLTRHGFVGLPTEWWHFDDVGWPRYPIR